MTMWELNMKAQAWERMEHEHWHKVRVHASLVLQPHMKGNHIDPRKVLPLHTDVYKPASDPESFQKALDFFRNRNWKKDKVIN